MPLIRHVGSRLLQAAWAAPASQVAQGFVREMGTERRPGESGAWKSSGYRGGAAWGAVRCGTDGMGRN
jgi:hypothetical protein